LPQSEDFDDPVVQQVFAVFGDQARVTCISCPLQVEGTYGSRVWYFRARSGRWTLGLGPDDDAAVAASMSQYAPYPITDAEKIWSEDPDPLSAHGSPEPDDQVDAGTFGLWLVQLLEELTSDAART
jgi:hypothetical protein